MRTVYLHRTDFLNPGDLWSCPMHYFGDDNSGLIIDTETPLNNMPEITADVLVVGGGAILSTGGFCNRVSSLLEIINAKHRVLWAPGIAGGPMEKIKPILGRFDLVSSRDYKIDPDIAWVPCASVLNKELREAMNIKAKRDFLIVDHFKRSIDIGTELKADRIVNKPNDISMISRMAKYRTIITASYHAAYWATLLGRKVIVVSDPLLPKFRFMKWAPVIAEKWDPVFLDMAKSHEEAYTDCKRANHDFYVQFRQLIGLPVNKLSWMDY